MIDNIIQFKNMIGYYTNMNYEHGETCHVKLFLFSGKKIEQVITK